MRSPADGGWSPARIGMHVALSNELLAGGVTGAVPITRAVEPGFIEKPNVFSGIPGKVQTLPKLEPPRP